MLTAFLTQSGNSVILPDAVALGGDRENVCFVDAKGRTLVIFRRKDICLYSANAAHIQAIEDARTQPVKDSVTRVA